MIWLLESILTHKTQHQDIMACQCFSETPFDERCNLRRGGVIKLNINCPELFNSLYKYFSVCRDYNHPDCWYENQLFYFSRILCLGTDIGLNTWEKYNIHCNNNNYETYSDYCLFKKIK